MAEARISVLWDVASVSKDEVFMASSWCVGGRPMVVRGGGLRISVRLRIWCKPEETCLMATKVKTPVVLVSDGVRLERNVVLPRPSQSQWSGI